VSAHALERVTRVRGVRGSMLVSESDGLIVAEALIEGMDGRPAAALAASLAGRLRRAMSTAGLRPPAFFQLKAERGMVLAVPAGADLLLVAIAEREANVGLARIEMLAAAEALR
jgi:predicted regulator of Ras-like GTPase activity (Roadblock/LC7/MglB family)